MVESNVSQSDTDADGEGDACDLNDDILHLMLTSTTFITWQDEGFTKYNLYRGDLGTLLATGQYTQPDGENAQSFCHLRATNIIDSHLPEAGEAVFYLVTGLSGNVESTLDTDSDGTTRPNTSPCR